MTFALVDCNNFYASCERVFNPHLEQKPIIILSNNDGCVIARSNEAKKLGIPMGAPFFKWEKFCLIHKVYVFSSNYELYGDMSWRIMTLLRQNCPDIEIYSIDEAFLLLDHCMNKNIVEHATALCYEIKRCTGLPVSIGIGATKTLAKVANYIAKKYASHGVFNIDESNLSILTEIPIEKVWGIGRQLAPKLKKLGVYTAYDLQQANPNRIRKHFSVVVEKIVYELRGTPCLSLETIQPRKQIISSRSFGKKITLLSDLEEAISHYAATAAIKLRKQNSLTSAMGVFLHTNFFNNDKKYQNSVYFPFPIPTCDTSDLIHIAKKGIQKIYRKGYYYQKAGIVLLDLTSNTIQQQDLFTTSPKNKIKLLKTVDSINSLYGKNAIFYCAQGINRPWQLKSERRSPCYTTRWQEILQVK